MKALRPFAAAGLVSGAASLHTADVPCERLIKQLDDAPKGSKVSDVEMAKAVVLRRRGSDECKAQKYSAADRHLGGVAPALSSSPSLDIDPLGHTVEPRGHSATFVRAHLWRIRLVSGEQRHAIRQKPPSPSQVDKACRRPDARPAQPSWSHDRHETAMSTTVSRRGFLGAALAAGVLPAAHAPHPPDRSASSPKRACSK
jgi:hypothetical protein